MADRLRPAALLLLAALLLTGCLRRPPQAQAPAPPPVPPPPPPVAATVLFPAQDWHLTFDVLDRGAPQAADVTEELVREPGHLVATYNGTPYITWIFNAEGIWRQDPKGSVLLRYLPPQLTDGEAWKQTSGSDVVWFHLRRDPSPCGSLTDPEHCWRLTMLNRDEMTDFHFAGGLGAVRVNDENFKAPDQSYVKTLKTQRSGTLSATVRKSHLDRARPTGGIAAPVTSVDATEFEAALQALSAPAARADTDGHGQRNS